MSFLQREELIRHHAMPPGFEATLIPGWDASSTSLSFSSTVQREVLHARHRLDAFPLALGIAIVPALPPKDSEVSGPNGGYSTLRIA